MSETPKLIHTPGPWRVDKAEPNIYIRITGQGWPIAHIGGMGFTDNERMSNAALIAEAGTVATETRMTPRQLSVELAAMTARAELAERQVAVLCGHIDDYGSCWNCPAKSLGAACSHSGESCRDALAAWSRAEAKKGGKG
jgi:hypothetical protein